MRNGETDSLTQALRNVAQAVSVANALAASSASSDELDDAVLKVQKLGAQFDALRVAVTGGALRTNVAERNGSRRLKQYVAKQTAADPLQVHLDVRLATWLVEFPEFEAAFAAGDMLREHLELVRKSADNRRTHHSLIAQQQLFIDAARDCGYDGFIKVVRYWVLAADTDGEEPREQIAKTSFTARKQPDGMVKINGLLDPLSGEAFLGGFESETQAVFRNDAANDIHRSHGQRGAAAILTLVEKGSRQKNGRPARPLFGIVMGERVAEDLLDRINNPSVEPFPTDPSDIDGRCELLDGTPIHPHLALAAMGVAVFRRQIMNAKGRTVDVSVNARCFTPWQKHALLVEARGKCSLRGCDAPFAWLQADHINPYSRGGQTKMSNGKILCDPENKHKRDKPAA